MLRGPEASILSATGNTPIVELTRVVPRGSARVFAKVESANPTGSMKDRMAVTVIQRALARGRLARDGTLVEYTAGTTGVSLGFVCAALGIKAHFVSSDAFSEEKRRTMLAFGAQLTLVPSEERRINETLIKAMIERSRRISMEPGHWWADQLNNEDAADGYAPIGDEIAAQIDGKVDAFVHFVATAHSLHGVGRALRRHYKGVRVLAVEPDESAVLSGRPSGSHKIEGTGIGFIPPLWRPEEVDGILTVTTADAKQMARRLASEEGIFAGTSTGGNVVAALETAKRLGEGAIVVTLIVDSGLRYISTDLFAQ